MSAIAPVGTGTSTIEWTERTWNPWTGCTKVSPGCAHCYIERQPPFRKAKRRFVKGTTGLVFHRERLEVPLRRRKPTIWFVNSLSDLFHEDVPDGWIAWVFWVMSQCPQHTFQVLTKRPERMRGFMLRWSDVLDHDADGEPEHRGFVDARGPAELRAGHNAGRAHLMADMLEVWGKPPKGAAYPTYDWMDGPITWPVVPDNVWLGVSIENRRFLHREQLLAETPAAVRFISAEPLLGPLVDPGVFNDTAPTWDSPDISLHAVDWLIVGGESGPGARRMEPQWARDLRDLAHVTGTAFLFKQWGGRTPKAGGRELDGRTWDEMPAAPALTRG